MEFSDKVNEKKSPSWCSQVLPVRDEVKAGFLIKFGRYPTPLLQDVAIPIHMCIADLTSAMCI